MVDQETSITWSIAAKVFWTIVWRGIVIALLIAALLEAIPFWLLATERLDETTTHFELHLVAQLLAWACGGLIAVRMALRKQYRGFRFQLVLEPDDQPRS